MKRFDRRLLELAPVVTRWLVMLAALTLTGLVGTVLFAAGLAGVLSRALGVTGWPHPLALLLTGGVLRLVAAAARDKGGAWAGSRAEAQLRIRVLTALEHTPARAITARREQLSGLIANRLGAVQDTITAGLPATVAACVVPLALLVVVCVLDPISGLMLAVTLPVVIVFLILVGLMTRDRTTEQWARLSVLSARFLDLLQGLPSLRIYGRAEEQIEVVRRDTDAYRRGSLGVLRTAFLSGLVLDVGATLSVALVAVGVGLRLDDGHEAVRTGLLVLLLTPEIFAPIRALGAVYHQQVTGQSVVDEVLDVIALGVAAADADGVGGTDGVDGLVDVTVTDAATGQVILDNVSVAFEPGSVTALWGPSGAGKTTVLALLLGHLEPTAGRVDAARDGQRIAWVPQRPRPVAGTAGAELLLGAPAASASQIEQALRDCLAVASDTELGENGSRLSAGQRRRLALAAALLRARSLHARGRHPLVLLDEPTEDLDEANAKAVRGIVHHLRGWATVVVATHDPAMSAQANRRVSLDAGRITGDRWQTPEPHRSTFGSERDPAAQVQIHVEPLRTSGAPARGGAASMLGMLPSRRRLLVACMASTAAALASVMLTATSVWLVCRAAERPGVQAIAIAVVGVRFFALAKALLRYVERLAGHDAALDLLAGTRVAVFARLIPLAPGGFAGWRRGDLLRRFTTDVDAAQDLLVRVALPLVGAGAASIAAVAIVAVNVPGALVGVVGGQLLAIVIAPALGARWGWSSGRSQSIEAGTRDRHAVALIDAHAQLQAHAAWGAAGTPLLQSDRALARMSRRQGSTAAAITALCAAGGLISLLAVTAVPRVSGPALGACVGALLAAAELANLLPTASCALGRVRGCLERVEEVLEATSAEGRPAEEMLPRGPRSLLTDELELAWRGGPLLDAGSATSVRPGSRIAVVGASGSGKSTLLAGLSGLLEPLHGRIYLEGCAAQADMKDLRRADRAQAISGSLDGDHVFQGTVRDNVTLGRTACDEQVWTALAAAGLATWLRGRTEGLDAPVGSDGGSLSGGQRQRLLLARALMSPVDTLVLDEPTAHLDAVTEAEVTASMLAALTGRTAVIVTHRTIVRDACSHTIEVRGGHVTAATAPPVVRLPDAARVTALVI